MGAVTESIIRRHLPVRVEVSKEKYDANQAVLPEAEFTSRFSRLDFYYDDQHHYSHYELIRSFDGNEELILTLLDKSLACQRESKKRLGALLGVAIGILACSAITVLLLLISTFTIL